MQNITSLIAWAIHTLYGVEFVPTLSVAPKPELGEYCTNVFPLAKSVGKAPNIISEEVASELAKHTDIFVSTSATGGYVNFFLTDTVWLELFSSLDQPTNQPTDQSTIVIDYIGANAGKPLHIGHICTPSIGQTICNLYRHLGHHVISDSHFGDWGGIFGKLIYAWKHEEVENIFIQLENIITSTREIWLREIWKNKDRFERLNLLVEEFWVDFILALYQSFHYLMWLKSENEQNLQEQAAREEFKKLSEWDTANVELWKRFTSISITETEKKLDLLNVHTTYNIGESFYEWLGLPRPNGEDYPLLNGENGDKKCTMKDIVAELIEKWVATQNEDGSVGVVFPEEMKMPSCILQKKDGTGLYLTSDLAAIRYRLTNGWNPSKIIYSVDVRQQLHLKQVFTIAQMAWPELTKDVEFFHAFNGFIKLKEGAMSTRHGTVIFLQALIDEGNERTTAILEEKWRTGENALKQEDIQAITVGAIKYSYLAQDREKDVTFDWDKALSFEGNSGPYIQYAYVRAKKISTSPQPSPKWEGVSGTTSPLWRRGDWEVRYSTYDKSLIQVLARMDEVIRETADKYKPHILALYSYDVAVTFNSFYVHTPKILEETDEHLKRFRLELVEKTTETLKLGFSLLGIEMPSEM